MTDIVRRDFTGSRIIRLADLTAFAEKEVKDELDRLRSRVAELDRENQSLRVRLGEVAYDERTHRFADQLRDLIDRFYDGDDDFEARQQPPTEDS